MWVLEPTDEFLRRRERFEKKHPRELLAVLDNLDTYFKALVAGAKPQQIRTGFLHPEPKGVMAIDQKGGGTALKATRLYLFPDETTSVVHLITVGDKQTQPDDIQFCKRFVDRLYSQKG